MALWKNNKTDADKATGRFNCIAAFWIFTFMVLCMVCSGCELIQQGLDQAGPFLRTFILQSVQTEVTDALTDKLGTDWAEVAAIIAGSVTTTALGYVGLKKLNGKKAVS